MSELKDKARRLISDFKGDTYGFGVGAMDQAGERAKLLGSRPLVVAETDMDWVQKPLSMMLDSLKAAGLDAAGDPVLGAKPNAPRADLYRLETYILHRKPDSIVVLGGGSGIDAVKAASVLAAYGAEVSAEIDDYFGVGQVTAAREKTGKKLLPILAIQMAAASGAHLTKYSNITDPQAAQKKLIVDPEIIPPQAIFDYGQTTSQPPALTADGATDGIAHILEVLYGAGDDALDQLNEIAAVGIELLVRGVPAALENPRDTDAREALGLGTDLGGLAIMVGGTNGGHLTSFSLVDIMSHGRACGVMNPYYTVFFAPKIEQKLRLVGGVFQRTGYMKQDPAALSGRALGEAVARAMLALSERIAVPTRLSDVDGFSDAHISRALAAAKDPKLEMKLKAMPVPLGADTIDEYMGPILEAAKTGDLSLIKNMPD